MKLFMRTFTVILLLGITMGSSQAANSQLRGPLNIALQADPSNPSQPMMGDKMRFHSTITNTGTAPIKGLVGWISLVEVDPGHEQPMDLEDWSAHKAITGTRLEPGAELKTVWPMRLIQHGDYRVVISATDRNQRRVYTSSTLQFHVTRKPVVKSSRILPVALGIPFLIGGLIGLRIRHQKALSGKGP